MRKKSLVSHCALSISILALGMFSWLPIHSAAQTKAPLPSRNEPKEGSAQAPAPSKEDFTSLTLASGSLRMEAPILYSKDETPGAGFARELFNVTWRSTDPFDLYVIRPPGTAKVPVVIYLYSYAEDTEKFKNSAWCQKAVEGGYAAVGLVAAVTGHRTRYRLPKDWFVSEMQESLGATVHDVQRVLDYLATRKDLDMNRVGMFGTGSGGSIAILSSAADARIRVLDLLGPWGDWPRWVAGTKVLSDGERATYAKRDFLDKVAPLEPVTWLPKIKARALRIQDVRNNKAMPDDAQEKLEAAAPDFAEINQFGNGAAFLASDSPGNLFEWMKGQLKTEEKSLTVSAKSQRIHFFPAVDAAPSWLKAGVPDSQKPPAEAKSKEAKEKEKPDQNHN